MRKTLHLIFGLAALAGINIGFIKVIIFLYHQWGAIGIAAGLTFLPPILICPVWEWIATGHYLTFLLVYVVGLGGLGLRKITGE